MMVPLGEFLDKWRTFPLSRESEARYQAFAQRVLAEPSIDHAAAEVTRYLLEGNLTPWSEGYTFDPSNQRLTAMKWLVAGGKDPEAVFATFGEIYKKHEPRCQEVWNGDHMGFRCHTCGISSNSCICVFCFLDGDHANHDYSLYTSNAGGCCDCGDPLAWKESGYCKRHRVPAEPRPILLPPEVERGAQIAFRAMTTHLLWTLRRTFFLGVFRPELSGCYGLGACLEWLDEVIGVCADYCKIAGECFNAKRDVWAETTGWGNFCPSVTSELVADESATAALLRLGLYLPVQLSFLVGSVLLKLLLDAEYKKKFVGTYVICMPNILEFLGALNVGSAFQMPDEEDHESASGFHEEEPDDSETSGVVHWPGKAPSVYSVPKAPSVLRRSEFVKNASRFTERISCQLLHSESLMLPYAKPVLSACLCALRDHLVRCSQADEIMIRKVGGRFVRRCATHMDFALQRDSICWVLLSEEELFQLFLDVLGYAQHTYTMKRRLPEEPHVEYAWIQLLGEGFQLDSTLNELCQPLIRSCATFCRDHPDVFVARVRQTKVKLDEIHSSSENIMADPLVVSIFIPLSRFFLCLLEVGRANLPTDYSSSFAQRIGMTSPEECASYCVFSLKCVNLILQVQNRLWLRNGEHEMHNLVQTYVAVSFMSETDLASLSLPVLLFPEAEQAFDALIRQMSIFMDVPSILRVSAAIALNGSSPRNPKRTVIHLLATHNYTYSQLEAYMAARLENQKSLDGILKEVADYHEGSSHRSNAAPYYSLKPNLWEKVCLGGVYLTYTRQQAEEALTRYKQAKHKEDELFLPVPPFDFDDPVCRGVFSSVDLRGFCLLAFAHVPEQEVYRGAMDEVKIVACMVLIGVYELERRLQLETFQPEAQEDGGVSLKSVFHELLQRSQGLEVIPPNILNHLRSLCAPPAVSPTDGPSTVLEDEHSTQMLESQGSQKASSAKTRGAATKAQQKMLQAFAKKQKALKLAELETEEGPTGEVSNPDEPKKTRQESLEDEVCILCRSDNPDEVLSMLVLSTHSSLMWTSQSFVWDGPSVLHAWVPPGTTRTPAGSRVLDPLPGISPNIPQYAHELSLIACLETLRDTWTRAASGDVSDVSISIQSSQKSAMRVTHTCGHCVHSSCLEKYRRTLVQRARQRQVYEGMDKILLMAGEILCPMCRRVTNGTIPMASHLEREPIFGARLDRSANEAETVMTVFQDPVGRIAKHEVDMDVSLASSGIDEDDDGVIKSSSEKEELGSADMDHDADYTDDEEEVDNSERVQSGLATANMNHSESVQFEGSNLRPSNDALDVMEHRNGNMSFVESRLRGFASAWYLKSSGSWALDCSSERRLAWGIEDVYKNRKMMYLETSALGIAHQLHSMDAIISDQEDISSAVNDVSHAGLVRATTLLVDLAFKCVPHPQNSGIADLATTLQQNWTRFVQERFGLGDNAPRETMLSADLTVVLLQWLLLWPPLKYHRFNDVEVRQEALQALSVLLLFARLQDCLVHNAFELAAEEGITSPDGRRVNGIAAFGDDARKSAIAFLAKSAFQEHDMDATATPDAHMLKLVDALVGAAVSVTSQDVMNHLMKSLLKGNTSGGKMSRRPFLPRVDVSMVESNEKILLRHAGILFGERIAEEIPSLSQLDLNVLRPIIRQSVLTFLEQTSLPSGSQSPWSDLSSALLVSAKLPRIFPKKDFVHPRMLVRLPQDMNTILLGYNARGAVCLNCHRSPKEAIVCLTCGTLLCNIYDPCCNQSRRHEISEHGRVCPRGSGEGSGVFLQLKTGRVTVCLDVGRFSLWRGLYVDAHDEEDRHLSRGKRSKIVFERYMQMENMQAAQDWMMQSKVVDMIFML